MPASPTSPCSRRTSATSTATRTCGQRALYDVGMTGIPVINVNNNCSTGSTALFLARQAVESGAGRLRARARLRADEPGRARLRCSTTGRARSTRFDERPTHWCGLNEVPLALRYFGGAGRAYMKQYGTKLSTFAKITREGAAGTRRTTRSRSSATVVTRRGRAECAGALARCDDAPDGCPPTCGAAAAIVCSDDFARSAWI